MSSRTSTVVKNFNFPGSDEPVEFITYKNVDGSFRNSEAVFNPLKICSNAINDLLLGFIDPNPANFYNVRVMSPTNVLILEYQAKGENKIDFETERTLHALDEEEISSFKEIIVEEVTTFLEFFSTYYNIKYSIGAAHAPSINTDLATFLRFANGAKIRFLEELCSLYLALNGQSYFDVIGHITMTGAFTYPALFSTTGLYYAANRKLIGKELIHGASRKTFSAVDGMNVKGEIHTKHGITILHLRQMRLRQKRVQRVDNYEPIYLIESDKAKVVNNGPQQPIQQDEAGSSKNVRSENLKERAYDQVKKYRILNLNGIEKQRELQDELIMLMSETDLQGLSATVRAKNLSSFNSIFKIFDMPQFKTLMAEIDDSLNGLHTEEIMKVVLETDIFVKASAKGLARRHLMRFLGIVEPDVTIDTISESLVQRFRVTSNPDEVLIDMLDIFVQMMS